MVCLRRCDRPFAFTNLTWHKIWVFWVVLFNTGRHIKSPMTAYPGLRPNSDSDSLLQNIQSHTDRQSKLEHIFKFQLHRVSLLAEADWCY
jgi:hypothetical protein